MQKEKNTFEFRVAGFMGLGYFIWNLHHFDFIFNDKKIQNGMDYELLYLFYSLGSSCGQFAVWSYATQYMKTCKILPYLLEKAKVLLVKYNEE